MHGEIKHRSGHKFRPPDHVQLQIATATFKLANGRKGQWPCKSGVMQSYFIKNAPGSERSSGGFPIQGISMRPFPGLVHSVPAVAYLLCLNLSAAFSQPGNGLIEIPCI